ncbi:hypothetical protein PPERSA_04196 [Pseudocohnilembus persalinus]|uniref:Uncharacterized protein n=1 Tax=Pseudocohnilembus persalinus TaxID=266149 RepID=A0A0V0QND0_PSEPJ|nr:hypothetical protein PPERSA_04196 [Pseudocohnilembus persalinus]|eukprot:KRX03644.1 hypothetical protein PPERSA_04196 [Pseudocohnilembus persalinus]
MSKTLQKIDSSKNFNRKETQIQFLHQENEQLIQENNELKKLVKINKDALEIALKEKVYNTEIPLNKNNIYMNKNKTCPNSNKQSDKNQIEKLQKDEIQNTLEFEHFQENNNQNQKDQSQRQIKETIIQSLQQENQILLQMLEKVSNDRFTAQGKSLIMEQLFEVADREKNQMSEDLKQTIEDLKQQINQKESIIEQLESKTPLYDEIAGVATEFKHICKVNSVSIKLHEENERLNILILNQALKIQSIIKQRDHLQKLNIELSQLYYGLKNRNISFNCQNQDSENKESVHQLSIQNVYVNHEIRNVFPDKSTNSAMHSENNEQNNIKDLLKENIKIQKEIMKEAILDFNEQLQDDEILSPLMSPLPDKIQNYNHKIQEKKNENKIDKLKIKDINDQIGKKPQIQTLNLAKALKISEYNANRSTQQQKLKEGGDSKILLIKIMKLEKQILNTRKNLTHQMLQNKNLSLQNEQFQRNMEELQARNEILVESYKKYTQKWSNIWAAFQFYKSFYQQYSDQIFMLKQKKRNQSLNKFDIQDPLSKTQVSPKNLINNQYNNTNKTQISNNISNEEKENENQNNFKKFPSFHNQYFNQTNSFDLLSNQDKNGLNFDVSSIDPTQYISALKKKKNQPQNSIQNESILENLQFDSPRAHSTVNEQLNTFSNMKYLNEDQINSANNNESYNHNNNQKNFYTLQKQNNNYINNQNSDTNNTLNNQNEIFFENQQLDGNYIDLQERDQLGFIVDKNGAINYIKQNVKQEVQTYFEQIEFQKNKITENNILYKKNVPFRQRSFTQYINYDQSKRILQNDKENQEFYQKYKENKDFFINLIQLKNQERLYSQEDLENLSDVSSQLSINSRNQLSDHFNRNNLKKFNEINLNNKIYNNNNKNPKNKKSVSKKMSASNLLVSQIYGCNINQSGISIQQPYKIKHGIITGSYRKYGSSQNHYSKKQSQQFKPYSKNLHINNKQEIKNFQKKSQSPQKNSPLENHQKQNYFDKYKRKERINSISYNSPTEKQSLSFSQLSFLQNSQLKGKKTKMLLKNQINFRNSESENNNNNNKIFKNRSTSLNQKQQQQFDLTQKNRNNQSKRKVSLAKKTSTQYNDSTLVSVQQDNQTKKKDFENQSQIYFINKQSNENSIQKGKNTKKKIHFNQSQCLNQNSSYKTNNETKNLNTLHLPDIINQKKHQSSSFLDVEQIQIKSSSSQAQTNNDNNKNNNKQNNKNNNKQNNNQIYNQDNNQNLGKNQSQNDNAVGNKQVNFQIQKKQSKTFKNSENLILNQIENKNQEIQENLSDNNVQQNQEQKSQKFEQKNYIEFSDQEEELTDEIQIQKPKFYQQENENQKQVNDINDQNSVSFSNQKINSRISKFQNLGQ